MKTFVPAAYLAAALLLPACGSDISSSEPDGSSATGDPSGAGGAGGAGSVGASTSSAGSGEASSTSATGSGSSTSSAASSGSTSTASSGAGGAPIANAHCGDPPPPGAKVAPPPPQYAGTCPDLAPGTNTIVSSGAERKFILALPSDYAPGEKLPVLFLWHWLGGDAQDFLEKGEIQAAADTQRFIAVIPEKKGDLLFTWPFEVSQSQARIDEELAFFDDMLACVAEKLGADENCISTAGVSAGALFVGQLASARADRLASAISLSGGVGGLVKPWGSPERKIPFVVLWGGPKDNCFGVMNFEQTSKNLEDALEADGHFFIECVHNCGHSAPPIEAPPGQSAFASLWGFALDHPYWLGPGQSPYLASGLPEAFPAWCAIGKGNAKPKEGACTEPPGC